MDVASKARPRVDSVLPEFRISRASSGSTGTESSYSTSSSSIQSVDVVTVGLEVIYGERIKHGQMKLCSTDEGSYSTMESLLKRLREKLGLDGDVKSIRVGVLSGGGHDREEHPLPVQDSLDDALERFQTSGFTTFCIRETIRSRMTNSSGCRRQELRQSLNKAGASGVYNGSFIPFSALKSILSKSIIRELLSQDSELKHLGRARIDKLANKIHNDGRKVLATILLANINPFGELLVSCEENALLDLRMPFPEKCPSFCTLESCDWTALYKRQWEVVPLDLKPHDDSKKGKNKFPKERVVPFVEMHELSAGGFGDVFSAKVHPEYHNIPNIIVVGAIVGSYENSQTNQLY
jgi:hypothetical protein